MRLAISCIMFCIAGTVGAQTAHSTSGLFVTASTGVGEPGAGNPGAVVSAALVAKSTWFAFTVAPMRLIVEASENERASNGTGRDYRPVCSDAATSSNSPSTSQCRGYQVSWSAVADAAVRLSGTPVFVGGGFGATTTTIVPVGTVSAYLRRDTKLPVNFRVTLGDHFIGAELGLTFRVR